MSLAAALRVLNQKVPPVPLPENPREPLQTSNHAGFPTVPPVPHATSKVQSVAHELDEGEPPGKDTEPANNPKPITVAAWTSAGTLMLVEARSVEDCTAVRLPHSRLLIPKRAIKQERVIDESCFPSQQKGGTA